MSVKTVLLGFLREGPLCGYELKRIIERAMGDWTDIAFGSIYFALDRLAKDGFVSASTEKSESHRPSRIVYTITEQGRGEYLRLLRQLWQDESRHTNPIDIAVAFIRDLPPGETEGYLEARRVSLEHALAYLSKHEEETMNNPRVPPESRFIFSHARHQLEAELAWTRELLDAVPSLTTAGQYRHE